MAGWPLAAGRTNNCLRTLCAPNYCASTARAWTATRAACSLHTLLVARCPAHAPFSLLAPAGVSMDEVFILRAPPALAERLRRLLAEDGAASSSHAAAELELVFSEDGRTGHLRVGADTYPAKLLDLPTKAESWKTLDDVNLVKAADIGQIIVVAPPGAALPTEDVCLNGITVAMRCVRAPTEASLPVSLVHLRLLSATGTRSGPTFASLWSMTRSASARWRRTWRGLSRAEL